MNEELRLENADLVLKVLGDGRFSVGMKAVDCEWLPDPWEEVACQLVFQDDKGLRRALCRGGLGHARLTRKDAGTIELTLVSRDKSVSAETSLSLEGSALRIAVRRVDLPPGARLVSVEYPFRSFYLRSDKDDGYLALPSGEGCMVPTHPVRLGATAFWKWEDVARRAVSCLTETNPAMPFHGACKNGAGYAAHLEYTNGAGAGLETSPLLRLFSVPLCQLVFHDALVQFCNASDDYTTANGTSFEDKVLRDLARGLPPMFFLNLRDHRKWRWKIMDSYAVMSDPAAAVLRDEMLTHECLTDDQMVQRTIFSSGVEIRVNFDEIEREGLAAKGYEVKGLSDGPRRGGMVAHWER